MIYKVPVIKGALTLLCLVCMFDVWSQTQMPNYYYTTNDDKAKSLKGITLEFSPYSIPVEGLSESFKPSFLDVSLGYSVVLVPTFYKAAISPEFFLFGNYSSYAPSEKELIYPVYTNDQMVDYGSLSLSNLTFLRGGAQIIFWNNTRNKFQVGPGLAISVGQYKYNYTAQAKRTSSLFAGQISQEFVMFSPSFAFKYWIKDNMGVYLSFAYNIIKETTRRDETISIVSPALITSYATFSPRIGLSYNFNKR